MTDPIAAAQAAGAIPWGTVITAALSGAGTTGLAVIGAMKILFASKENAQKELVEELRREARSADSRALSAEKAQHDAERRESQLKHEFKETVRALGKAVRLEEVQRHGVALSVPPPSDDDPTIRFFLDASKKRDAVERYEQEERDRERSIGNQTYLQLPEPSKALTKEAMALEAFVPGAGKRKLPRGAGREDHLAHKKEQELYGVETPEQPVVPYRTRQKSHRDGE